MNRKHAQFHAIDRAYSKNVILCPACKSVRQWRNVNPLSEPNPERPNEFENSPHGRHLAQIAKDEAAEKEEEKRKAREEWVKDATERNPLWDIAAECGYNRYPREIHDMFDCRPTDKVGRAHLAFAFKTILHAGLGVRNRKAFAAFLRYHRVKFRNEYGSTTLCIPSRGFDAMLWFTDDGYCLFTPKMLQDGTGTIPPPPHPPVNLEFPDSRLFYAKVYQRLYLPELPVIHRR